MVLSRKVFDGGRSGPVIVGLWVAGMWSIGRYGGILLSISPGDADIECAGVIATADGYVAGRFGLFDFV